MLHNRVIRTNIQLSNVLYGHFIVMYPSESSFSASRMALPKVSFNISTSPNLTLKRTTMCMKSSMQEKLAFRTDEFNKKRACLKFLRMESKA